MRRRPLSVRLRLTLWYAGVLVVVLGVYAAGVFVFVSRSASKTLDDRLQDDYYWAAEMLVQQPDGSITWPDTSEAGLDGPWLQVWSPDGELLYRTGVARMRPVPNTDRLAFEADRRIVRIGEVTPPFRVFSVRSSIGGQPVVIQVARSEFQMRQDLYELLLVLVFGLPIGVAAAALGGYTLARRALAPVDRMAERARSITAERLTDRLPVDNPDDELGRLASVFNEMLTRLEGSFEQMRRFTSHVSHELRTPLTAIRSVGEVALRGRKTEGGYRETIGSMLEEVDSLSQLIDRLLTLSRAETAPAKLSIDRVDLGDLAGDVASQLEVLAEEKNQSIRIERDGDFQAMGDRLVLRQALLNLVDNAIKYTPEGGSITIRLTSSESDVAVEVSDTGPGIPPDMRGRIFDRFWRAEHSAARERGGAGLGLSIAKWAVEVNGGRLTLEDKLGHGSTFRITLPQAPVAEVLVPSLHAV